ncbi:hypothetical protein D3C81_2253490 [compost metagenome]
MIDSRFRGRTTQNCIDKIEQGIDHCQHPADWQSRVDQAHRELQDGCLLRRGNRDRVHATDDQNRDGKGNKDELDEDL